MLEKRPVLTLISRHYFTDFGRKTTVHFIARNFATFGYDVKFVSVGRSRLSMLSGNKQIPQDLTRHTFTEIEPHIHSIVMDEWIHPVSTSHKLVNCITSPNLLRYGNSIPNVIKNTIKYSDIVLVECGYGVAYTKTLKALCPNASFVYFATDPLPQVGLRQEFEAIEQEMITQYDVIRVAAPQLAERFPKNLNIIEIPQGLEKKLFDDVVKSPYPIGTKNVISIGDMAFDSETMNAMAMARPDVTFHIFGVKLKNDMPQNIILHGEVEFSKLVPYIKFADVGIMPYKMSQHLQYLTKTSLKFLQYSYAGLPIMTPEGADWGRDGMFYYNTQQKESVTEALNQALACEKSSLYAEGIWDWHECAQALYDACERLQR